MTTNRTLYFELGVNDENPAYFLVPGGFDRIILGEGDVFILKVQHSRFTVEKIDEEN